MSSSDPHSPASGAPSPAVPAPEARPEDRTGPIVALRTALEREKWSAAVKIIGGIWALLLEEFPADLDAAFQLIPVESFRTVPAVAAVREIWLSTSIEPQHLVPSEPTPPSEEFVGTLHTLADGSELLRGFNAATAHMIAARVGGRLADALEHAKRVEAIGRSIESTLPAARRIRYPAALLQAGITRAVAGDVRGALPMLQNAYERSPYGRSPYVAKGAAGNLALFSALDGDIDIARRWLARHDAIATVPSPHAGRVLFTGDLARTLIAIEAGDRSAAEQTLQRVEQGVNVEQTWGPMVAYLHARHGLLWGDRLRALAWVRRDQERYRDRLGPDSTMAPLLASAEVDLLLAIDRGDQALARWQRGPQHPVMSLARARIDLLTGEAAEAAQLAAEVSDVEQTSRVRTEGLLIDAIAALRADDEPRAAAAWRLAVESAEATGAVAALLCVGARERRMLEDGSGTVAGAAQLERDVFPAEVSMLRLTGQEALILRGMAEHSSQQALADAMFLSLNTVKTHLRVAYRKLGASSRTEALRIAARAGLL